MSADTTPVDRLPATSGSDAQQQLARMKARAIARYKLVAVPGRAEEYVQQETRLGVSFGYGCRTIRVRKMQGRTWVDHVDFQIEEGWSNEMYTFLDSWFGRPGSRMPIPTPPPPYSINILAK